MNPIFIIQPGWHYEALAFVGGWDSEKACGVDWMALMWKEGHRSDKDAPWYLRYRFRWHASVQKFEPNDVKRVTSLESPGDHNPNVLFSAMLGVGQMLARHWGGGLDVWRAPERGVKVDTSTQLLTWLSGQPWHHVRPVLPNDDEETPNG